MKKFKQLLSVATLMMGLILTSCGSDNTTSTNAFSNNLGVNCPPGQVCNQGIGGVGGSTGNMTLDSIVNQIQCQSSAGPQAFQIVAYTNQGGQTAPFSPQASGYDIVNTYVGRTSYGDVVIVRDMGGYSELIVKACNRAYIQGNQVVAMNASNLVVNVSNYCSVNEITSGQVALRYQTQQGTYDLNLLPNAMHLHNPTPSVCQGQGML